ncbi:MAG: lytic transglycosylase domain-containing protein [Burkholderiales bacterium]|nr:lytic transglycosylase domain-containing protein [Burkholderiales bacterium]
MRFWKILTPLRPLGVALCCVALHGPAALAQPAAPPLAPPPLQAAPSDSVILDMREAARRGDKARLAALLPAARGHALEPWAAYWELKARLEEASAPELQDFLTRYAGTYQEDRLRNDWLLLSGKRRDWTSFAEHHPAFRMRDDREVRCYAVAADLAQGRAVAREAVEQVRADWFAQRDIDDGCLLAAGLLHQAGKLPYQDLWKKARLAIEANRPGLARAAVELDAPDVAADVAQIQNSAMRYLATRAPVVTRKRQELVTLALIKLASSDPDQAAAQMDGKWAAQLTDEERNWVWAVIAKQATLKLQDGAAAHLARITRERDLSDDLLTWATRAALRQGDWARVRRSIDAMSEGARRDPAWTYWLARAQLVQARGDTDRAAARQLLEGIAGVDGFYEKLALEELGRPIVTPPAPAPLTAEERDWARRHPGLHRGLHAIALGLRSEGVREWNYWTNLHSPGGKPDRELYAAADLACQQQVWDRCINTSERTKGFMDFAQRFPMPHQAAVVRQARAIGLDPAYVYGLIRQESRFIMDARSHVGASGLMQIMPATARWTARKIGLEGFTPGQINELDTNILIGTSYLKLALDEFRGSMPLAAAAYNAGPGRPRAWRNGPRLEAAVWAETIPFGETRDYVKKVLSNTTDYAALLSGQPQSLKSRLGSVGPAPVDEPVLTKDLP